MTTKNTKGLKAFLTKLFCPEPKPEVKVGQLWTWTSAHNNPFERKTEKLKILAIEEGYFEASVFGLYQTRTRQISWLQHNCKLIEDISDPE